VRPVLFSIGPFRLFGYGAMIVLGGIFSFGFLRTRMKKLGLKTDDDFWILVNVCLLSGFFGGRILYLIEYTTPFSVEFWRTLVSPSQGFSILGDFVSVPIALWLFARWKKVSFLRVFDTVCVMAAAGHVFGRFGCLLAGCCHGRPTHVPWGIVFRDPRSQVPQVWLGMPLHPTQLYEAFGNAVIAACLYRILRRTENGRPGLVAVTYFASYGVLRFFEEYYRGDTVPLGRLGLTAGQGLGAGLVAFSLALLAWRTACIRRS
jgi:phosphatidylglycerol:prolipoprotein diacylglycerol transferase